MTTADTFNVPDSTLPEVERRRRDALAAVLAPFLADDVADIAETLAAAALAYVDTQDRPGRAELAAAWTRGWLFSYGQDHGYTDERAHALAVPDHLTDDLPVWNPYDPTEAEPDPWDLDADVPVQRERRSITITFPPLRDSEGSMVMAVQRPRRLVPIQYRLDGVTVRSVLGFAGGEHACRASYGLTVCLLPKDHIDYDEVLIDGTLYADTRDWHQAGPTIRWPVTGKADLR